MKVFKRFPRKFGHDRRPRSAEAYPVAPGMKTASSDGLRTFQREVEGWHFDVGCLAAVGTASFGTGYWGQLDLVGEALQWTLDLSNGSPCPEDDCAFLGLSPVLAMNGRGASGFAESRETTH